MLNTLNWNANGVSKKRASLIATLKTENIDVALIQETLLRTGDKFKIPGYVTYTTPKNDSDRGLAILIKNTIPSGKLHNPIPCGHEVENMAVTITLQTTQLTIYNIYRKNNTGELQLGQLFAYAESNPTLISGDFNAHHPLLSSPSPTNEAGEHIEYILEEVPGIALLNNGEQTHIRGGRLDLTFLTANYRPYAKWEIHPNLMSDHFATKTQLNLPQLPAIPPPPPRWNQELADWNIFQKTLEDWSANYIPSEDTDQLEEDLIKALHQAADKSMPIKATGNYTYRDSWYYCQEVRNLKTRLNRVRKLFRKRRTEENLELLRTVNNDVQQKLEVIRTEKWLEWCTRLSQHSSLAEIWKWLKRITGKKKVTVATHPQPQQEAERLAQSFAQRTSSTNLPPETRARQEQLDPNRWETINAACLQQDETDRPYTQQELQAVKKVSRDTAPGADRITYTMIYNMGTVGDRIFLQLLNKTHTEHTRPKTWNQQDTQPIPKPKDPSNPRPIALVSCLEKTAEKMVLNRLKFKIGPLHKHLYAYQDGIGTTECITDVLSCINGRAATVAFLDFEKAFELAKPSVILQSLARRGIKGHLLAWNKNYLLNREARVKFQGTLSSYKILHNGTPQGGILSPFLFNILMENIASLQLPTGVDIFIFADDVCIISRGPRRIMNLQKALGIIHKKTIELGLKINTNKSKVMAIKSKKPNMQLSINFTALEWVESYMYLGVHIDSNLRFDTEIKYLREKAKTRLASMRYMTSLKEGANFQVQKAYYLACTRSLIDYATPTLLDLSDNQKEKLEVIQNNAMRLMLGAPMWTRLCILRAETGLTSLENRISQRNICISAKALLSERDSFTRRRIGDEINKDPAIRTPKTYGKIICDNVSRLSMTQSISKLKPDVPDNHTTSPPWDPEVATFKETKLPHSKNNCTEEQLRVAALGAIESAMLPNSITYYTDGSVDPDTNTTGAAVYSNNYTASWRLSNHASTMQTELIAILQALQNSTNEVSEATIIHTDSKAAWLALQQKKVRDNRYIIGSIKELLLQHKANNRRVVINWIPSHIGIHGNDKADELAKTTKHVDRVQIKIQPSLQQIKNYTKPIVRKKNEEDINFWINQGSYSAIWYKASTQFIPPPISKNTPRELAVIIHRLRLGYKASWEIIDNLDKPCSHCNEATRKPLLHYLLECSETTSLRTNVNTPADINTPEAITKAAEVVKDIIESFDTHADTLLSKSPPR